VPPRVVPKPRRFASLPAPIARKPRTALGAHRLGGTGSGWGWLAEEKGEARPADNKSHIPLRTPMFDSHVPILSSSEWAENARWRCSQQRRTNTAQNAGLRVPLGCQLLQTGSPIWPRSEPSARTWLFRLGHLHFGRAGGSQIGSADNRHECSWEHPQSRAPQSKRRPLIFSLRASLP
jgi:hypothetical protein